MQTHTQQPSSAPARAAVAYVCRLLRNQGVESPLTPEQLRLAKFDAPASAQPVLLALHDLCLLVLAGFPPGCAAALAKLKQQLQQEALQDTPAAGACLSHEGRLLLLHCLSEWGCPVGLVAQLTLLPQPSSRAALLALAWLIAHAQLFDRAMEQLQLPAQLLPLLPPYPEDASFSPEGQRHYWAAASAAQQHTANIRQLLQHQQQHTVAGGSSRPSKSGVAQAAAAGWLAVQTAAHHVLDLYRGASLRLQQLANLVESRQKLLHSIKQTQQQQSQHQQSQSPPGGSSGSSRAAASKVLTAFELHLLARPALLQQHQDALAEAVGLLLQQRECRRHADVFFSWATSAIEEVVQQQQQQQQRQGGTQSAPGSSSSSSSSSGARPQAAGTKQQQTAAQLLPLPAPALQDILPLVQQLPASDTPLAASVLGRVQRQLQQSAEDAGIGVSHPAGQLLSAAMGSCSLGDPQQLQPAAAAGAGVCAAFTQAAAAALVQAGVLPDACVAGLLLLPEDVQQRLQRLQEQETQRQQQQQEQLQVLTEALQHGSLQRTFSAAGVGGNAAAGVGGNAAAGGVTAAAAAADELQRLNGLALQVAKLLARTRATNTQQLSAAAQSLLQAAQRDGRRGEELVLFQC